jgi:lipid-A-disaccharide synthase
MSDIIPDLFILAGEQSGDLHGGHILHQLRIDHPEWKIMGVSGPKMREEGIEEIMPMEELQVMGFTEIILSLPKLVKQFYFIRNAILKREPKVTFLIDYPGFNLRLAKSLRKAGYKGKIIHFICPSVWAWGKGRIPHMAATLDRLLTIFPFEAKLFDTTPLKVSYVGHPLVEALRSHVYDNTWKSKTNLDLDENKDIIGIFPGSRRSELALNLANQLSAARELQKSFPSIQIAVSCSQNEYASQIQEIVNDPTIAIVPKEYSYELMRDCHTAIASSGTVTLELACHNRPTLVTYHVKPFNRFVAQYILKLKLSHYCIVNILSNQTVYPELIEIPFTVDAALGHLKTLYNDLDARERCISVCKSHCDELYLKNSMGHVVKAIEEV